MPDVIIHLDAGASRTLHVAAGDERPLSDLLRRNGLPLNTRCGERWLCDGCALELVRGSLVRGAAGSSICAEGTPQTVRGCDVQLADGVEPLELRIPARSLLAYEPQVCADFVINVPRAHDPLVALTASLGGESSGATGNLPASAPSQANTGSKLPVAPTPHPNPPPEYRGRGPNGLGAAVDIGTTTVAVLLVDLRNGTILARAAAFNQQVHLGDDVVTRINLCGQDPAMLPRLQRAVADQTLAPLLAQAMREAGTSCEELTCMTIAANTTMLHLLVGIDPTPLGVAPFTPQFLDHRALAAGDVIAPAAQREHGLDLSRVAMHLLPGAAAYIGADLTAGAVASGLAYDPGPSLLVDVGTNGEILLKHEGRVLGCATAAGPAFEGAGLACGVRAGAGAVSHLRLHRDPFRVEVESIGGSNHDGAEAVPLTGICGSAYVDFLAEARAAGLLNEVGRFDRAAVPGSEPYMAAASTGAGSAAFVVAHGPGRRPITISAADVASLLQAKAAIAAGILTLLGQAGLEPRDIRSLYLAGGFGTHMRAKSAIGCGLLPGFHVSQIRPVGNSAIAGAYLALLDRGTLAEMTRVGREMRIVELNLDPTFEGRFIEQLML